MSSQTYLIERAKAASRDQTLDSEVRELLYLIADLAESRTRDLRHIISQINGLAALATHQAELGEYNDNFNSK